MFAKLTKKARALLASAINVALLPLFVWILKIWMDATFRSTWEDGEKPKLFRKLVS